MDLYVSDPSLQANLSNANLEGALATGNTSFRGSNINGAGTCITKLCLCYRVNI